jgi:hypothetical protein
MLVREKPRCVNEDYRIEAHRQLDDLLDEMDGVKDWFGTIGVRLTVYAGQVNNLQQVKERNTKLN